MQRVGRPTAQRVTCVLGGFLARARCVAPTGEKMGGGAVRDGLGGGRGTCRPGRAAARAAEAR
eukprot:454131-Prymnesium_polylepis.1